MTKKHGIAMGALLVGSLFYASVARADLTEPETKHVYAATSGSMVATGVGVRTKIGFDVYSVALYVEKSGALAAKPFAGNKEDMKLYNAILDCKCTRMVSLKMARSVGAGKIKDGFIESLSKNLDIESADVKADVEKLTQFLGSAEAGKGMEYKFTFGADGSLDGKGPGGAFHVVNAKLARGFLGNWIGQNPIATKLRANLVSELASIQ